MINNDISYYLTSTLWVRPLRDELHSFCGTWLRCNFLEWGALERRTRGPAKRGSGSTGDVATAFQGARIPLRGHTFLRKALLRPARSHHSASLRLALYPQKPHTSSRPTTGFRIISSFYTLAVFPVVDCPNRAAPVSSLYVACFCARMS